MSNQAQYAAAAIATVGAIGGAYAAYRLCHEASTTRLPDKWTHVGTLKELYIYPVKSCGTISVDKAECTFLGLKNGWLRDRVLMVVDESYNFITARVYPELLLVKPSVKSSILTLEHPSMEPLLLDLAEVVASEKPKSATVWGFTVSVYDCGLAPSEWFNKLINRPSSNYRLVYYASQKCRIRKEPKGSSFKFSENDRGAFPDDTSFNFINEASVSDLNKRLKGNEVAVRQFRPNFILSGSAKPYDEDNWKFIKIGQNIFEIVMPCTRCVMTTIDPDTGAHNPQNEPLGTLKSYRQVEDPAMRRAVGSSPRMGLQMALRSDPGGVVALNDPIYVA